MSAAYEDFGLAPLEAASFGRPAVTLRAGGFLDTVVEGETGVFFDEPEPGALSQALAAAMSRCWDPQRIRAHAEGFSEERFIAQLRQIVLG